eukprot:Gb_04201 [translate_table: standard]
MDHFNHYKPPSTKIPFKKEKKYHVFLSFRGPDVRTTFVDHLYLSLTAAGIHTFLDSEKLEKGQDIGISLEDAINHSDILIPIFSPCYAGSYWCLKELGLMCSSRNKIIPLFYNVEPGDVRHPDKGVYAVAFHKHQDRHTPDTVNHWKNALKQVCDLSGWTLEATCGYQGKLVKQIVTNVLKTLDIMCIEVAKHPVGLEERWNANTAVKNLCLKSLIRVDKYDGFVMHDHLLDLGRRIVTEESMEEPGKRSRLWHPPDGTARVRSLLYSAGDDDDEKKELSTESLGVMNNLQFLSFERICIKGKMGDLPPTLKWLKFNGCELRFLAYEWNMEDLVSLELTNGRLWMSERAQTSLIKTNHLTP